MEGVHFISEVRPSAVPSTNRILFSNPLVWAGKFRFCTIARSVSEGTGHERPCPLNEICVGLHERDISTRY